MNIGYVIDSTVDLPEVFLVEHGVKVIPLNILWDGQEYQDRVDLSSTVFFERLATSTNIPTSSAPAPGLFLKAYQELLDEGKDVILSLHLSSKFSGTFQAATLAASMMNGIDIKVIDTQSASLGSGLLLMKVVDMLNAGYSLADVLKMMILFINALKVFLLVDNLDYLHRGGRIGKAEQIIGSLLNVKPILSVENGVVVPYGKIYGQRNIIGDIESMFKSWKKKHSNIEYIGFAYSNDKLLMPELIRIARRHYPEASIQVVQVSPVIGCHVGPGLIGFAVL